MPIDFPGSPTNGQVYTYGSRTWTWTGYAWQATTTTTGPQGIQGLQGLQGPSGFNTDIVLLDNLQPLFDGVTYRFRPTFNGTAVNITNSQRLLVALNGIVQRVSNSYVTWDNPISRYNWLRVDADGYIVFSQPPAAGTTFDGRVMGGPDTTALTTTYPFAAADLLIGAF
jgi:hypothetical protein